MKHEDKHFSFCPNCNSEERIAEDLLKEAKEIGVAQPELRAPVIHVTIMPIQQGNPNIPVGVEFSSALADIDICAGCGTLYATDVFYGKSQVGKMQPLFGPSGQPIPPSMRNPEAN